MLTFKQVQTILNCLAERLDEIEIYQFLKTNTNKSTKFYYTDGKTGFTHLYYAYKDNWHIRLCWLTQETYNSLLVSEFIESILVDAETVINLAREEQIKPFLTRIDSF